LEVHESESDDVELATVMPVAFSFPLGDLSYHHAKALTMIVLTMYVVVLQTTLRLLNCVHVPGVEHPRRLFVAADTVKCYETWWQPLLFIILSLVLFPFPFIVWYWHQSLYRQHSHHNTNTIGASSSDALCNSLSPAQLAVMHTLQGPYRTDSWVQRHWETAILFRRLVLVSLHTFLQFQPFWQAFSLAVCCIIFLATHLAFQPFIKAKGQNAETSCLSLLVVISLLKFRQVDFAEVGMDPPSSAIGFNKMTTDITTLIVTLLCIPLLLFVLLEVHRLSLRFVR
jgi:hypothetical protein